MHYKQSKLLSHTLFCLFWPVFLKDIATYFCLRERSSRHLTFWENWSESWGNITWPRRRQIHSQKQRHANNVFFKMTTKVISKIMDHPLHLHSLIVAWVFQILPFWYQSLAWPLKHFCANPQNAIFTNSFNNCKRASIPVRSGGWNVPKDQRHASATSSDVYLG